MARSKTIQHNDLKLKLTFSFRNLVAVKEATGVDLLKQGDLNRLTESDVFPGVIWGLGGGEEGTGYTLDEFQDQIDPLDMKPITDGLVELLSPDPS